MVLPAGVAGYLQTTSWGQWFNVRIPRFTFRDRQDRVIAQGNEQPNQRQLPPGAPRLGCQPVPSGGPQVVVTTGGAGNG